jgi:hypothetical protein
MPIFGITASSNQSIKLTDFYQIATTTVGSGGAANIEFTSIPQNYTHLQIRGISKHVTEGNDYMQFNSDTGSNYSWHELWGDGATAFSSPGSTQSFMKVNYGFTDTSVFGEAVIDILDYKNTNKFKTIRTLTGATNNSSAYVLLRSGNWRSTNAITSIKIYPASGNFSQYSSYSLYGVTA